MQKKIFRDNSCRLTDSLCFNLAQDQLIIIANSKENYISTHLDKYFPKGINIKIDGESDYASIGKGSAQHRPSGQSPADLL